MTTFLLSELNFNPNPPSCHLGWSSISILVILLGDFFDFIILYNDSFVFLQELFFLGFGYSYDISISQILQ